MINGFFVLLGACAFLIQFASAKRALATMNYWHVKKTVKDLGVDAIVFVISMTGGVYGFYIAVTTSFLVTVYLNWFTKEDFNRPQPKWWLLGRVVGSKLGKHF